MLQDAPQITEEDLQKCRDTGDYSPVMFEWYKFVAGLCVTFSNLLQESPVIRKDISERDYGILIGLINRAYRLMLTNVALSHEGEFGESTSILDRCIFESCVILSWLCATNTEDRFDRYVASGLRTELELKDQVNLALEKRGGDVLLIEKRMLDSVADCIAEAGFVDDQIREMKPLPNLAAMLEALGYKRFAYTAGQRIGSHHVHGTWVGLRNHFIEKEEDTGRYRARQKSYTHINQYVYITSIVLAALSKFVDFVFEDADEEKGEILNLFESTDENIRMLNIEIVGGDFDAIA